MILRFPGTEGATVSPVFGVAVKTALTETLEPPALLTLQVLVPGQLPADAGLTDQPVKVPDKGDADRVTLDPPAGVAVQVAPQEIGPPETVPDPVPDLVTFRLYVPVGGVTGATDVVNVPADWPKLFAASLLWIWKL